MSQKPFSHQDWLLVQQDYWDKWLEMSHQVLDTLTILNTPEQPFDPTILIASLEQWRQSLQPSHNLQHSELLRKLLEQGKSYLQMSEAFIVLLQHLANPAHPTATTEWAMYLDKFQNTFTNPLQKEQRTYSFLQQPFDNWQQLFAVLHNLPQDVVQNLQKVLDQPHQQALLRQLEALLQTQGASYSHEWQKKIQKSLQLRQEYQQAQQAYQKLTTQITTQAIEKLKKSLLDLAEQGKNLTELRALYNLWIECSESTYIEFVQTEEYSDVHARLINTTLRCKQHEQSLLDEVLQALNLPTRQELDNIQRRLYNMRRDMRIIQEEQYSDVIHTFNEQIALLRQEMSQLTPPKTKARKRNPRKT